MILQKDHHYWRVLTLVAVVLLGILVMPASASQYTIGTFSDPQYLSFNATDALNATFSYFEGQKSTLNISAILVRGDLVEDESNLSQWSAYTTARSFTTIPVYEVPGNHDVDGDSTDGNYTNYLTYSTQHARDYNITLEDFILVAIDTASDTYVTSSNSRSWSEDSRLQAQGAIFSHPTKTPLILTHSWGALPNLTPRLQTNLSLGIGNEYVLYGHLYPGDHQWKYIKNNTVMYEDLFDYQMNMNYSRIRLYTINSTGSSIIDIYSTDVVVWPTVSVSSSKLIYSNKVLKDQFTSNTINQYYGDSLGVSSEFTFDTTNKVVNESSTSAAQLVYFPRNYSKGTLTVNINQIVWTSNHAHQIIFGANNTGLPGTTLTSGDQYLVNIYNSTGQRIIQLLRQNNGTTTTLGTKTFLWNKGTFYNITTYWNPLNTTSIIVYIDGTQYLTSTDKSITSGFVGFGSYNPSGGFWYTNLTLDTLDPPVAQFTPTGSLSTNYPNGVYFTDTSTGSPTAWDWQFNEYTGNNTWTSFNTSQNPTFYGEVGTYGIRLNASTLSAYNISIQDTTVTITGSDSYTAWVAEGDHWIAHNTTYNLTMYNTTGDYVYNSTSTLLDVLNQAGGASGGGGSTNNGAGSGGAGGTQILLNYTATLYQQINIHVGAKGAAVTADHIGNRGENSTFDGNVAWGGGYAATPAGNGGDGGSGGSAANTQVCSSDTIGGSGIAGQGQRGGNVTCRNPNYNPGPSGGGNKSAGNSIDVSVSVDAADGADGFDASDFGYTDDKIACSGGGGARDGLPGSALCGGGDGSAATAGATAHAATSPGSSGGGGAAYFDGADGGGAAGADGMIIIRTLLPPLQSSFIADKTSGVSPLSVIFTDTSTGNPNIWVWAVNGTEIQNSTVTRNFNYTFIPIGIHQVNLTVWNTTLSTTPSTSSQNITVSSTTYSDFTISNDHPVIFQDTVTFTPIGPFSANGWLWNFGDGITFLDTNGTAVTHKYESSASNTTLSVSLTAYIIENTSVTNTTSHTISPVLFPSYVEASFSGSPTTGSVGVNVIFTDNSKFGTSNLDSGRTYNWSFGDNDYSATPYSNVVGDVSHVYTNLGTYTVTLNVNNTLNSSSYSIVNFITVSNQQNYAVTYPPKDVRFHIQTLYGQAIPNTLVQANPHQTSTGSYSYTASLFGYQLGVVPLNNLTLSGYTDSKGDITLAMMADVQYELGFSATGYTFDNQTITPHDDNYIIMPRGTGGSPFITNGSSPQTNVLFTATYTRYNETAALLHINYTDYSLLTTGGDILLYRPNTSLGYTFNNISEQENFVSVHFTGSNTTQGYILIDGATPACPSSSSAIFTDTYTLVACTNQTLVNDKSYFAAATGMTPGGNVSVQAPVWFKNIHTPIAGLSAEFALFAALGIMMFTAMMATPSTAPAISIAFAFEGWIFYGMNMLQLIDSPTQSGASVVVEVLIVITGIAIVYNFVDFRRKGK